MEKLWVFICIILSASYWLVSEWVLRTFNLYSGMGGFLLIVSAFILGGIFWRLLSSSTAESDIENEKSSDWSTPDLKKVFLGCWGVIIYGAAAWWILESIGYPSIPGWLSLLVEGPALALWLWYVFTHIRKSH